MGHGGALCTPAPGPGTAVPGRQGTDCRGLRLCPFGPAGSAPTLGSPRDPRDGDAAPDMIWIAILLIVFMAIGLGQRASGVKRHLLVVLATSLTLGVVYLGFGGG